MYICIYMCVSACVCVCPPNLKRMAGDSGAEAGLDWTPHRARLYVQASLEFREASNRGVDWQATVERRQAWTAGAAKIQVCLYLFKIQVSLY